MACGVLGARWLQTCSRSCRGWSLQCTLTEAQTQTLAQAQAHGVHMHAERTDTGTCAQRTDACRSSLAMVKLGAVPLHRQRQRQRQCMEAEADGHRRSDRHRHRHGRRHRLKHRHRHRHQHRHAHAHTHTHGREAQGAGRQQQKRCKVAEAAEADRHRHWCWHRHRHQTGTCTGTGADADAGTGTGTGTGTGQRRRHGADWPGARGGWGCRGHCRGQVLGRRRGRFGAQLLMSTWMPPWRSCLAQRAGTFPAASWQRPLPTGLHSVRRVWLGKSKSRELRQVRSVKCSVRSACTASAGQVLARTSDTPWGRVWQNRGPACRSLVIAFVVIRLGLSPRQCSLLFLSATSVLFVDVY